MVRAFAGDSTITSLAIGETFGRRTRHLSNDPLPPAPASGVNQDAPPLLRGVRVGPGAPEPPRAPRVDGAALAVARSRGWGGSDLDDHGVALAAATAQGGGAEAAAAA